jgi:hypothetical protein
MNPREAKRLSVRASHVVGACCILIALFSVSLNLTFGLTIIPLHFLRGFLAGIGAAVLLQILWTMRRS